MNRKSTVIRKAAGIVFWLVIWQIMSMVINRHIILVSPVEAVKRLAVLCTEQSFIKTVANSFLRISCGFFAGFAAGIITGALSCRYKAAEIIISPFMSAVKAVPVASFIIFALFWIKSSSLSVLIPMLMVMPLIFDALRRGVQSTDKEMLEAAEIFRLGGYKKARYLYLPSVMPFLTAACRSAAGLAFKSGTAAEVIGQPDLTLGDMLYRAKIYLETADLFAWTAVIIILGKLFEMLVIRLLKAVNSLSEHC